MREQMCWNLQECPFALRYIIEGHTPSRQNVLYLSSQYKFSGVGCADNSCLLEAPKQIR
jgi:hypothetical protein